LPRYSFVLLQLNILQVISSPRGALLLSTLNSLLSFLPGIRSSKLAKETHQLARLGPIVAIWAERSGDEDLSHPGVFPDGIRLFCIKSIVARTLIPLMKLTMKKLSKRTLELGGIRLFLFFPENKRIPRPGRGGSLLSSPHTVPVSFRDIIPAGYLIPAFFRDIIPEGGIMPAGHSFRGTNKKRIILSPLVNLTMKKPSMKNGISGENYSFLFFLFRKRMGGALPTGLSAARRRVHRSLLSALCLLLSASCFLPSAFRPPSSVPRHQLSRCSSGTSSPHGDPRGTSLRCKASIPNP
jgi:hypothetical protein